MAAKELPSPEELRNLLDYDPDTGKLTWRARPDARVQWNTRFAGKDAIACLCATGYLVGTICKTRVYAHRIAFAIMVGRWPEMIDHISGDRTDNRWANLREVSPKENAKNACRRSDNTSGVTGVCYDKKRRVWAASIFVERRRIDLGRWRSKRDAIEAREKACSFYGFSERHGNAPSG
jgi:hypothetical protein